MRDKIVAHVCRDAAPALAAEARALAKTTGNIADQLIAIGFAPGKVLEACCSVTGLPPAPLGWLRQPVPPLAPSFDGPLCRRLVCAPIASQDGRPCVAFGDPEIASAHDSLGLPPHDAFLALTSQLDKALGFLPNDDGFDESTRAIDAGGGSDLDDATAAIDPIEALAAARASMNVADAPEPSDAKASAGTSQPAKPPSSTAKPPATPPATPPAAASPPKHAIDDDPTTALESGEIALPRPAVEDIADAETVTRPPQISDEQADLLAQPLPNEANQGSDEVDTVSLRPPELVEDDADTLTRPPQQLSSELPRTTPGRPASKPRATLPPAPPDETAEAPEALPIEDLLANAPEVAVLPVATGQHAPLTPQMTPATSDNAAAPWAQFAREVTKPPPEPKPGARAAEPPPMVRQETPRPQPGPRTAGGLQVTAFGEPAPAAARPDAAAPIPSSMPSFLPAPRDRSDGLWARVPKVALAAAALVVVIIIVAVIALFHPFGGAP